MVKQRFQALDMMRGLTLALMILVNTPGSWSFVYAPLEHADWHGVTPTDFIFPFFLFMVGAALFFSQRSLMLMGMPASQRHLKIIKRTLLLFSVGVFLNAFPFSQDIAHIRILGVLQRIALAYCISAIIVLYAHFFSRLVIAAVLLLGYWALLQLNADPYSLEHSLVRQVDLAVLGADHLWLGKGIAFDPEGLLSTLPSVVNVLIGYEVASALCVSEGSNSVQKKLVIASVFLIVVAVIWGNYFPINKSLWTSPFVLLTSGVAVIVLLLINAVENIKICKPALQVLLPLGKNPLFIYSLVSVWSTLLYSIAIGGKSGYELSYDSLRTLLDPYNASLAFALIHVLMFWCVAKWLDKKGVVIAL